MINQITNEKPAVQLTPKVNGLETMNVNGLLNGSDTKQ